ncbi:hypothetical protein ACP8HI_02175 [Paenibacillus sp. FA6]|uniref:hypothetical protein n=1 Tax=Paenibacillus sp. FA6 TaxID=3413029 RepID=UPI003F65B987
MRKLLFTSLIWLMLVVVVGCSNNTQEYSGKVEAEVTLRQYTDAIADQDAGALFELYGGSYEWIGSFLGGFLPELDLEDKKNLFEAYVVQGLVPRISLNEMLEQKEVNKEEYIFEVNYLNEDGSAFVTREVDTIKDKEFTYTVKKVDGKFKVMELPPYQP